MIKKDSPPLQFSLYKAGGFYGIRVPAFSIDTFYQVSEPSLFSDSSWQQQEDIEAYYQSALEQGYKNIHQIVFHSSFFQIALATASQDIVKGLTRLQQNEPLNARSKRLYSRLLRYLIRISTRSTPFGLFAGVSLGHFSDTTQNMLQVPAITHICIRPDMDWLFSLLQRTEQTHRILPEMKVMVNCTAYVAGGRVILPAADVYGQKDNRTISLRYLPILQYILEKYHQPIFYAHLVQDLQKDFSHIEEAQLHQFLAQLWDTHILVSMLRPPITYPEVGQYLVDQLRTLPEMSFLQDELQKILACMNDINHQGVAQLQHSLESLSLSQQKLLPDYHRQPFHLDAALNIHLSTIHSSIAEAAAKAAEILLRIGKAPKGLHSLRLYRQAFVEKYGEAEVKILELLSPEKGLGVPSGYAFPPRADPLPLFEQESQHDHHRDRILCSLFASAMNTSDKILHLTDAQLKELLQWTPGQGGPTPPASLDVFLQIQANSEEDISNGAWESIIVQSLAFGGRSISRFVTVFEEKEVAVLREFLRQEAALFPDTLYADLNYLPPNGIHANMIIRPVFHSYEIAVNMPPSRSPEYMVPLDDLVVGVSKNRFYVRSLRLGKEIKVFQRNMLNERYTPNVCRFLLEVAYDGSPYPENFDWGILSESPFLPRVTYQNIVMNLATWNLRCSDIQPEKEKTNDVSWFLALQQWREKWNVPRYVYLTYFDNRLLLDLANPLHVQELLVELKKEARLQIQEMYPDFSHHWLRDTKKAPYVAELTVPVLLNTTHPMAPDHCATHAKTTIGCVRRYPHTIPVQERRYLPDSQWKYFKLYVSPQSHNELIAGPLQAMAKYVQEEHLCDKWFYLRYNDPEPHIRIRFHAVDEQKNDSLLIQLAHWASTLVKDESINRYSIDFYDQEIERYGGPFLIDEVEKFFSINSDTMATLLAVQRSKNIHLDPLLIAVFSTEQLFISWNYDFSSRLHYIQARTQPYETIEDFRLHRSVLTELLFPWKMHQESDLMKQRSQLLDIFIPQQAEIASLCKSLEQKECWQEKENIVASLAHMQINRFLGTDTTLEQKVYAMWRHTLESVGKRPPQT